MEPLPKMDPDLPVCPKFGTDLRAWFNRFVPKKAWDGVCPGCKVKRQFKVGAALVGSFFAVLFMLVMALPSGGGRSGGDCGSAYREVLQRQAAGRLTDGAVDRLANCRRSSLPVDGDAMRDALKAQEVADPVAAAAAEKRTQDVLKRTENLVVETTPLTGTPVGPAQSPEPTAPAKPVPVAPSGSSAFLRGHEKRGSGVSMDYQNTEVADVLRALAKESGRNIVPGEDVKGRMTVTFNNVTWERALDTILEVRGLSKVEKNGVIFVNAKARQ